MFVPTESGTLRLPRTLTGLSLTDDSAVDVVLSDVPFFGVGVVALAVFTFFLVMRKASLLVISLYISSLLSFIAAILDLSQMLVRGVKNTEDGLALGTVTGLIDTREVEFSLSVGFRFLFFWILVSERPGGEPPPPRNSLDPDYSPRYHDHSASWKRWGYLGFILRWGLLAFTLSIPVLQMLWRIALRKFGVVYMVESTIEIAVSGLFVLKILLNIFLSPLRPWWRPFVYYVTPILALAINLGVGVGNLVYFTFSETTLGRFLQAIELYILILFTLIATFYKQTNVGLTRPSRRSLGASSFTGLQLDLQDGEIFRDLDFGSSKEKPPRNSYIDMTRPGDTDRPMSWDRIIRSSDRTFPVSPKGQRLSIARTQDLESGLNPTGITQSSVQSPERPSRSPSLVTDTYIVSAVEESGQEPEPGTPDDVTVIRPTTTATTNSIASYYGYDRDQTLSNPLPPFITERDQGSESPIYGLNGIIQPTLSRPSLRFSSGTSNRETESMSSFDDLLRQQQELDRSIAALRLFSPRTSSGSLNNDLPPALPDHSEPATARPSDPPIPPNNSLPRSLSISTNSYSVGQRQDSESNRSVFSLSIFPEPPVAVLNSLVAGTPKIEATTEPHEEEYQPPVPQFIRGEASSIPSSPNQDFGPVLRTESNGTQYDVTSFIGDLTIPGLSQRPLSSLPRDLSDVESEDEVPAIRNSNSIRPLFLEAAAVPAPESSESRPHVSQLKPLLLPRVNASSSPLPNGLPIGPRRPLKQRGLGPRVQFTISHPQSQGLNEQAPGAFERPRPPPLLFLAPRIPGVEARNDED